MKVIVTGGGTAGHVTPLLAVVSELVRQVPDVKISYFGTKKDTSSSLIVGSEYFNKRQSIFAGKFRRYNGKPFIWYIKHPSVMLLNIRDIFFVGLGFIQSLYIMIFSRPSVVFVTGGYVGLPVGLAATVLRIPIVTNDLDTVPGLTNKVLSRFARGLAVAAPLSYYPQYANKPAVYCGVPVRKEFLHPVNISLAKQKLNINSNSKLIVITGGSSGAGRLNSLVYDIFPEIIKDSSRTVYWLCGLKDYKYYQGKIKEKRVIIKDFESDMISVLSAADLVVSRAGATTLAEIAALAKPLIIVPSKMLTGGHQIQNANIYADANAATVLDESLLDKDPKLLLNTINTILSSNAKSKELSDNIVTLVQPKASLNIANVIIDVANGVSVK
ncbi:UDP-N-acetylglucosamine--N-acetylmuramyl-(pentapeptide) pyrophosphoryl-undecaprenol N-acetylglucosamine transferase [Candidatus Saccharibacteria bacterium]|nr:UDP-N-acetylglucosamine--N-acetylmuramyl-(pentapeptide) pyrophosphoryl-undecaprenol N-acetylglucosamine transferase [Candidatus Saccharibacteria bacterium]